MIFLNSAVNPHNIISDIIVHSKYAKFLPELHRRETWEELCERNRKMHHRKFPDLIHEIDLVYDNFVLPKKVLPSMRTLQFSGKAIERGPQRSYNCAYLAMNDWRSFSEVMFLLLSGCGVGYSVQSNHIEHLPEIKKSNKRRRYLISDSIEGWADSVRVLMRSYFEGRPRPRFDFSDIRPKGSYLVTSGGKAPGPEPLQTCLHHITQVLDRKNDGDKLTSFEVHEINCFIAEAVLAGGIRRSAMISLFDVDDHLMLESKTGNWWEEKPHLGRCNNSAVFLRHKIDRVTFDRVFDILEKGGFGEPGFYLTNDRDIGTNPCAEISLRDCGFCNLVEINSDTIEDQADLEQRIAAAAFIGTLQASYTDFHYLRDTWKKNAEEEALLGISMTGIASWWSKRELFDFEKAVVDIAKEVNYQTAKQIGINPSRRITTIKPAGTTSLVLGTSSGVHSWHSKYFIRRIRFGKDEAIAQYLHIHHPEIIEDEFFRPTQQSVVSIPLKAPENAVTRENETALDVLDRVLFLQKNWIKPGHIKGNNTHNVSCTINVRPEEWEKVREWMWKNREHYAAISVLPFDGGKYTQAPFEEISEKQYWEKVKHLSEVDLRNVVELMDNTNLQGELACSGGACEIQ